MAVPSTRLMTAVATCWDSGAVVLNGYTDRAAVTVGGHGVAAQMPVDVGQAVERVRLQMPLVNLLAEGDRPLAVAQSLLVAADQGQFLADLVERVG
jgi:hypothetical protein